MVRRILERVFPDGTRRRSLLRKVRAKVSVAGAAFGLAPPSSEPSPAISAPDYISANRRSISAESLAELESCLRRHPMFKEDAYVKSEHGRNDLDDHLTRRMAMARTSIVPWLDHLKPLKDTRMLEIGCGTGSDLVALGEQGAIITAIDVDAESNEVARKRCQLYGLRTVIRTANAAQIGELFGQERFDWIVFYACIEHMTHAERLSAISQAWQLLESGGCLAVIETPNRLWHSDIHSARMPFFHWLPDELAFHYSRYSERPEFRDSFRELTPNSMHDFLRWGRGVSFHEFVLAIGREEAMHVLSYQREFFEKAQWIPPPSPATSLSDRYISVLQELAPEVSPAYFQPDLNLVLRKP